MIFKKKKSIEPKEAQLLSPNVPNKVVASLTSPDICPVLKKDPMDSPQKQRGIQPVDLPDVGEESLEILVDWYEKNFFNPYPNKNQLKRINLLTGLNKSTIRSWTTQVRKNKMIVVRRVDGTRHLAPNPYLPQLKRERKNKTPKSKLNKKSLEQGSKTEVSETLCLPAFDSFSSKHSESEKPIDVEKSVNTQPLEMLLPPSSVQILGGD
mmetsp:Transcript_24208/g.27922  ORF Transcript_24208/g.27922 Transcript_24208/m.27922 type:complete len:209 (-) Transcript_24208:7-633(-)